MDDGGVLAGLDDDQRRAVTTESRLVAVLAGAGSGKTRTLTRRVAYRVQAGTAEEAHALVLTFTREAAGELRRRLPRLGLAGRFTAGTFHAVALSMLQQRWRDLDQRPKSVVADRRRILARIAPTTADLDTLVDEIGWATARGHDADSYLSAARRGERRPALPAEAVAESLDAYRREKRRNDLVDLDDLLALTIAELERDPTYAEAQRWRFRHLLVDEAQDLNPLQHRMLDLLRAGRDDLFLVGDASQAIYGFNGSDPSLLIDVERRFPGVEVVRLPVNHRCTPQIVAAGTHVLRGDGQDPGELCSARPDGPAVQFVAHDDEQAEAAAVAAALAAVDRSLVRSGSVAVLARTNAQLPPIERALAAVGVEVRQSRASARLAPITGQLFRFTEPGRLRSWAHDTLELDDDVDPPRAADDTPERQVARVVLDFLREHPLGDGPAFRAWVDATDPFGHGTRGVELLTFHGAKGREWHTVHLVGCETSLVPHRSATTVAARQEEARLLYVALTRATDQLVVNWARRRAGYQRKLTPLLDGFHSSTPEPVPPPTTLTTSSRSARSIALERLHEWRREAARARGVVPEALCPDTALAAIASADTPPADPDELDALTGLGALTARRLFPGIAAALEAEAVRR